MFRPLALGRQFSTGFPPTAWELQTRPQTAPKSAPAIAALVSVSPPRITVSITGLASKSSAWSKLPKGVLEGNQDPALQVVKSSVEAFGGVIDRGEQAICIHFISCAQATICS